MDWTESLRVKSSGSHTRKLLSSEGGDRFRAAERIQHDSDRTASGLAECLKLGEKLSRTMRRPPNVMFVPTSAERSVSANKPHRVTFLEDGDQLHSKTELLAQVHKKKDGGDTRERREEARPDSRPQNVPAPLTRARNATAVGNPLRSSHLWSKKSFDMYKRIQEYVDKSRCLSQYDTVCRYKKGDPMGVVDTFYRSDDGGYLEHCSNDWIYFKSRFEVSKTRYIQTEVELLVLTLLSRPGLRRMYDGAIQGDVGGTASIAPMRAVLKAVSAESPRHEILVAEPSDVISRHSDTDTGSTEEKLHVRPLYTAGDLMLALFELMDPRLFRRGYIQVLGDLAMRDTTGAWSPHVHYFRATYRVGKPNKWTYLCPSRIFDLRNEDLVTFLCPHLCPAAFESTPVPHSLETVEMKVWLSNFVRSFKCINGLGEDGIAVSVPTVGDGCLQSITVDVQLVRHVEDAYLHSSQVRRPTKAELRSLEQERIQIFDNEKEACARGDVGNLIRGGSNYEIKFRLLHVVEVKHERKVNPIDSTVGPAVTGFYSPRKNVSDRPNVSALPPKKSPSPTHPASARGKSPIMDVDCTTLSHQARNIVDEIPIFDVNIEAEEDTLQEETPAVGSSAQRDNAQGATSRMGSDLDAQDEKENSDDSPATNLADHSASPKKQKRQKSVLEKARRSINGAPEIEQFLKRCREVSAVFNSGKAPKMKSGLEGDEDLDSGGEAANSINCTTDDSSVDAGSEDDSDAVTALLKKARPITADSHYMRSKLRRRKLAEEKEATKQDDKYKKELLVLMELNSLRRNRRPSATPAVKAGRKKRSNSAQFMYSELEKSDAPVLFHENKAETASILNTVDARQAAAIMESHDRSDTLIGDEEEKTPSETIAAIMSKRRKTRLGRATNKKHNKKSGSTHRRPRSTLSSVGAGPPRHARNRVSDGSGIYSSSEDEQKVEKSVVVSEEKAGPVVESGSGCECTDTGGCFDVMFTPPVSPPQLFKYDLQIDFNSTAEQNENDSMADEATTEQPALLHQTDTDQLQDGADKASPTQFNSVDTQNSRNVEDDSSDQWIRVPVVSVTTATSIAKRESEVESEVDLRESDVPAGNLSHFWGDNWNCVGTDISNNDDFNEFLGSMIEGLHGATIFGAEENKDGVSASTARRRDVEDIAATTNNNKSAGNRHTWGDWASVIPAPPTLFGSYPVESRDGKNSNERVIKGESETAVKEESYPIIIGKKSAIVSAPLKSDVLPVIVAEEPIREAPSLLLRASSDGDFMATLKNGETQGGTATEEHKADQSLGNANRIDYCLKGKIVLRPRTVIHGEIRTKNRTHQKMSNLDIDLAQRSKLKSTCVFRFPEEGIEMGQKVSALSLQQNAQKQRIPSPRTVKLGASPKFARNSDLNRHVSNRSAEKLAIDGRNAINSHENKTNSSLCAPPELMDDLELEGDDEWKNWRLQQYRIWENQLWQPEGDSALTDSCARDFGSSECAPTHSVPSRPHTTPTPLRPQADKTSVDSPLVGRPTRAAVRLVSAPTTPRPKTIPHTSDVQSTRAKIVIPSTTSGIFCDTVENDIFYHNEKDDDSMVVTDIAGRKIDPTTEAVMNEPDAIIFPTADGIYDELPDNVVKKKRNAKKIKRKRHMRKNQLHCKKVCSKGGSDYPSHSGSPVVRFVIRNALRTINKGTPPKELSKKTTSEKNREPGIVIHDVPAVSISDAGDAFWSLGGGESTKKGCHNVVYSSSDDEDAASEDAASIRYDEEERLSNVAPVPPQHKCPPGRSHQSNSRVSRTKEIPRVEKGGGPNKWSRGAIPLVNFKIP